MLTEVSNKMVRFTLKKQGVSFSDEQKRRIKMEVVYQSNRKNFQDLESVDLAVIGDNYFVVRVQQSGTAWHKNFSRILADKCLLKNLCIRPSELFDTLEQDLD